MLFQDVAHKRMNIALISESAGHPFIYHNVQGLLRDSKDRQAYFGQDSLAKGARIGTLSGGYSSCVARNFAVSTASACVIFVSLQSSV